MDKADSLQEEVSDLDKDNKEGDVQEEKDQRTSTKDKLKQIALEERRRVNEMAKAMRKEASLVEKTSNNKVNDNQEKEKESEDNRDEDLVWEIEECPHLVTDECPPTTKYKKNFKAYLKRIRNARKCKGWKLELLVEFNTGERQWSMFHGPLIDLEGPTAKFMKDSGLTLSICGYKLDPKKMTKKKRDNLIHYDDFNHHNRTNYNIIQDIIHKNLQNNTYDNDDEDMISDDEESIHLQTEEATTENIIAENETTITPVETSALEMNDNVNNNSITNETLETTNNSIENGTIETTKDEEQNGEETETLPPDAYTGNLIHLLNEAASTAMDMALTSTNDNDVTIEICNGNVTISEHEPIDDDDMTTVMETMVPF